MIRELVQFNGGLSTKKSPHLISTNEGVICQNVDLESGTLKPLDSLTYVDNIPSKYFTFFDDKLIHSTDNTDTRFFSQYGGRLYWSNNGYNTYGLMKYDGTSIGTDAVSPDTTNLATNIDDILISEHTDTDNGGRLTLGATYNYAFTIVDTDGIESAPVYHPTEITLNVASKLSVKVSISDTDLADWTDVNGKNVIANGETLNMYRIGGDNPTYNLVREGVSPDIGFDCDVGFTCIRDNIADINVSRIELSTEENTPPDNDIDMLIENNGTFWGAVDNRVYFSRVGSPEFWGVLDFVVLDKLCTGIGSFGDSVVAFTKTDAYLISGDTRDNITKTKLPFAQGCTNKHSVANIGSYLLWTSYNGICIFNGSDIQILTKDLLSWDEFGRVGNTVYDDYSSTTTKWSSGNGYDIQFAVGFQDKYYGVYNDGCMILDMSTGTLKASTIYLPNVKSLSINADDNILMFSILDEATSTYDIYALSNNANKMEATWKTSKIIGESNSIKKHYRQVEMDGNPTNVKVYIDNELKYETDKAKFFLPSGLFGRSIQFEISTINEIVGLKFQYSLMKG